MVILLLAIIAKDTAQINDPYILRGFSQGLCLLVGGGWLLFNANTNLLKKYWPVLGYLAVSLLSGLFSPRMSYALIQTASLASVLLFSIAYFESQAKKPGDSVDLYFNTTIFLYGLVCALSLLMIKYNSSIVYSRIGNWSDPTAGIRFEGLFPISGMMAAASGLLVGFVIFRKGKWWWRWPILAAGVICLGLTQSRTFWVAAFVTSVIIWWFYNPKTRNRLIAVTLAAGMVGGSMWLLGTSVDTTNIEKSARVESIENLSGRVTLWELAMENISKRPLVGYGSSVGSYALHNYEGMLGLRDDRSVGHETLHNGYLQTVLDIGVFGLLFYIAIFAVGIRRVVLFDKERKYPAVIYGVLFMAIGNLGESIVYSAAVSHSVVFWCVSVFALYRFGPGTQPVVADSRVGHADPQPGLDLCEVKPQRLLRRRS